MADDRLAVCFGVHDHQPIGNFDHVVHEATARAYRPFLELVRRRPGLRLTVHVTGSLLEWLRERAPETFDLLGTVVSGGQVELLTGGFYEPILAVLPEADKVGQIHRLSEYLERHFGVRPRGMWLAERVWEPHLPVALADAGVRYVVVDDAHFAFAGLDPATLGDWYVTEDQGRTVGVVPISQRLRYLIPFADVEDSVRELARVREHVRAIVVLDDGEKFGAWPGTWEHVYRDGWLDRFFDRLEALPWVELATCGDVIERWPAAGRVYLPTASYREMGEWALTPAGGRDLDRAKRGLEMLPDGTSLAGLLRGASWRGFLVKYPEVADTYWKMLRVSAAVQRQLATRPGDARLRAAREAVWRGQANDAYWHGVFGGCYLPHLRRAVKAALLEAERTIAAVTDAATPLAWERRDVNGDGAEEIVVRTAALAVTLNPDRGGTLTELGWLPGGLDLADVLTRRPELYHDRVRADGAGETPAADLGPSAHKEAGLGGMIEYDPFRRASLVDLWLDEGVTAGAVAPWERARVAFAERRLDTAIAEADGGLVVTMRTSPAADPIVVEKSVTVRDAAVHARYRVRTVDGAPLRGAFAVQWNVALTAGHAPDRYLDRPDRPFLDSRGGDRVESLSLVDEWAGVEARIEAVPATDVAWGPVDTVSVSEGGFERIYQGTAVLATWRFDGTAASAEVRTGLTVRAR